MSVTSLTELRDYLKSDTALDGYMTNRYQKSATHYIGYRRVKNACDYPVLSYVPVRSDLGEMPYEKTLVSVIVGVYESGLNQNIFDGVLALSDITRLIVDALEVGRIGSDIVLPDGKFRVVTDLGVRHPFYETEIQFLIGYRSI